MQLQGEYTMVSSRLSSIAMMSGGVLDVEPFLISRNTLGNRKNTTQNLKRQMSKWWQRKVVVVCTWQCGSEMIGYTCVGVEVVVPKQPKHLRRHKPQLKKLKQNWVKLGWRKCMVDKPMWKLWWWWWLMKKQPFLSGLNPLGDSNHKPHLSHCKLPGRSNHHFSVP